MNTREFLLDALITISVTFIVAAIVTFVYSLIAHGSGDVDWKTAFNLAIVLGIVLPLTGARDRDSEQRVN
jgi:hypothetical protein